jgi:hypothetical protein
MSGDNKSSFASYNNRLNKDFKKSKESVAFKNQQDAHQPSGKGMNGQAS